MPNYLVFDTETTGLPPKGPRGEPPIPADDPRQPRLASFAAILTDPDGDEIERKKFYIRPDGWSMAEFDRLAIADGKRPASEINGLTDEFLNTHGVSVRDVLTWYSDQIVDGAVAAAFNAVFDLKIMRGELRRAGMPDLFEETPNICLMKSLWPYRAEGLDIKSGGYVKLQAACDYFSINVDNHEVMSDAQAAAAILKILIEAGRLPEPTIKRAKNHPGAAA